MTTSRVRAAVLLGNVISFEQRHTSVTTDFTHGLGERLTAEASALPTGVREPGLLRGDLHPHPGVALQLGWSPSCSTRPTGLPPSNTGSVRNIYSPEVRIANELMVDQVAKKLGEDPVAFRLRHAKSDVVRRG